MRAIFLRILAIFLVFATGFAARRRYKTDDTFCRQLSAVLMTVFYPCLIVHTMIAQFTLADLGRFWMLPVGAGLIMLLGGAIGLPLLRYGARQWPSPQRRTAGFLCVTNNYSFLPLMLASALWGRQGEAFVIFAMLGPELVVWTLGVQTLSGRACGRDALRHLCSVPMLAIGVSFAVLTLKAVLPEGWARIGAAGHLAGELGGTLLYACGLAGQATVPVSAVLAGMRMGGLRPRDILSPRLAALTGLRLVLIPGIAILLLFTLRLPREVFELLVVIATMPAAIGSVPMAELYDGDGTFAAGVVFATHLACLATIPLWLVLAGIRAW